MKETRECAACLEQKPMEGGEERGPDFICADCLANEDTSDDGED